MEEVDTYCAAYIHGGTVALGLFLHGKLAEWTVCQTPAPRLPLSTESPAGRDRTHHSSPGGSYPDL